MANSFIRFWQVPGLDVQKNFKIENIEYFLTEKATKTSSIIQIQYQKIALNLSVKLNIGQMGVLPTFEYNYARITFENPDTLNLKFYYYIENWQWLSENTIRLDLILDVLNSVDYSFDKKTKIIRQHGKQFYSWEKVSATSIKVIRNIDLHDEGITPQLYRKSSLQNLSLSVTGGSGTEIPVTINQNWFLIYRASENPDSNIPNKIYDLYLCAENPFTIYDPDGIATPVTYQPKDFVSQTSFYYVIGTGNGEKVTYAPTGESAVTLDLAVDEFIIINYKNRTHFYIWHYKNDEQVGDRKEIETLTVERAATGFYGVSPMRKTAENVKLQKIWYINAGVANELVVNGIGSVDRTDTKLIKIIEIPYQPIYLKQYGLPADRRYMVDKEKVSFDLNYSLLRVMYPWETLDQEYICTTPFLSVLQENQAIKTKADYDDEGPNDEFYESKIYQSAFYKPTIIYDSFQYFISLEKLESSVDLKSFNMYFYMTNTINSRFLFIFDLPFNKQIEEDYEIMLYVSRNNELPLLNSEYLDYIRNGYNFDVKAKQRKDFYSFLKLGTSLLGASTAETPIPSIAGKATSLLTTISSVAEGEESLQKKIQDTQMRGVSASNADAYDLMNIYARNRLLLGIYEVNDIMKRNLYDLFYYYGYRVDELGIPETDSRTCFNYVQCEAVFKDESLIRKEYRDRLRDLYMQGVTYIHQYVNHSRRIVYDIEQESANREVAYDEFLKTLNN